MTASREIAGAAPALLRDMVDGVLTLTLNRPEAYNALTGDLLTELSGALRDAAADEGVHVVVIAANGRAFCAGHDLREMRSCDDYGFHKELFDRCSAMMLTINAMPQPVIAQVNGIATAAGCQLVAAADLAIASQEARFAASGINLGLFCSTPAVPMSRNLPRKAAMQMLLTGEFISAQTALEWGLVNEVAAPDALAERVAALARVIADKSAYAVRLGKRLFYEQLEMDLQDAYAHASDAMARNMGEASAQTRVDAFLNKRGPRR